MSANELRRYMLGLFLLGSMLVCYLFWKEPTMQGMSLPSYTDNIKGEKFAYKKSLDIWSWSCENQRCTRKQINEGNARTSLETCSMLCGSTQLWPQPTGSVTLGSRSISFSHENLEYETTASAPARSYIEYSFASFNANIVNLVQKSSYNKAKSELHKFKIKIIIVNSSEIKLKLATNESYSLVLKPEYNNLLATITAPNFFGARHGLETLSQLIWWEETEKEGTLKIIKGASILDSPRFAYRGLMIDSARNFMPIDNLKRVLIGMSANKLNTFHWHISDSQSFSVQLPRVPQLAKYGAYSPEKVYSVAQVKDLVEFANLRGIRVVIEVDVPAHSGNGWSWGQDEGLGELAVCVNMQPWMLYCGEPPCGQLNPDNPKVYDVLEKVFRDLIELSGEDEIFHMGGDEVNLECWAQTLNRNASIYIDYHEIWGNFTLEALKRLETANGGKKPKHVMLWSSNLSRKPYADKYLNKDSVVIQTWGGSDWNETPDLIAAGYNVVVSHVDAWYLDCGFGRWRENGGAACDPYRTWQAMYNHQPWNGDKAFRQQMLGGEACLWSEQVDAKALDTRLWPRAAAFAERLWSDPSPNMQVISEDVYARLSTHRDRLVGRGLAAEALWPQWCSQNPGMCL